MTIRKLNNKGFSLIELMVVVAIIAILATVAIPQYQLFQAKSRRNEGITMLQAYFTAAQATFAEISLYPGNFVATGFAPTGQLHARITAANNDMNIPVGTPTDPACFLTSDDCDGSAGFMTWQEVTAGGTWIVQAPATMASVTDTTFSVVSSSMIKPTGMNDEWTINQLKVLANPVNGLQ